MVEPFSKVEAGDVTILVGSFALLEDFRTAAAAGEEETLPLLVAIVLVASLRL